MSAVEETKPVVPEVTPALADTKVEPTPEAPKLADEEVKPAETTAEESTATATEDKKAEAPKEEVKPVYEGTLSYTAPTNVVKSLLGLKSKYFFWFGKDAVPTQNLNAYLAHGKAEHTQPTAAWSNETGEGILYFVKNKEAKEHPTGALLLADVEDIKVVAGLEFTFKLHGAKHVLVADTKSERDGWVAALKEHVEAAKGQKETIHSSEGYKGTLEKLTAPAVVAASAITKEATPKKSSDSKSLEKERAARAEKTSEDKKKSRSQSRGKAFLAKLSGKKEETKEEAKETKEEAKEAVEEPTPAPTSAEPAVSEPVAAPVPEVTEAASAPVTAEEAAKDESTKDEAKKTRRGSRFIDFAKGALRSPTHEKKPEEAFPTKEVGKEEAKPEEAVAETAAVPAATVEAPAASESAIVDTPAVNGETSRPAIDKTERRRSSFFNAISGFGKKPVSEKKTETAKDEVKTEETPAVETETPVEAAKEEVKPVEEAKAVEPTHETAAAEGAKSESESEAKPKKENKINTLLRSASKAIRGEKREKKVAPKAPEKVEESTEAPVAEASKTETAAAVPEPEVKKDAPAAHTEQPAIGDVVADAVNVGSAPAVKASA